MPKVTTHTQSHLIQSPSIQQYQTYTKAVHFLKRT